VTLDEDGLEEMAIGGGVQAGGVVPDITEAMVHVDNFVEFEPDEEEDLVSGLVEDFHKEDGHGGDMEAHESEIVERRTVQIPEDCPPGLIDIDSQGDSDDDLISVEYIPTRIQGNDYSREAALGVVRSDAQEDKALEEEEEGASVTSPVMAFTFDADFDYDSAPRARKF